MRFLRSLIVGGIFAAAPAWAVYAPIPEQEQGKDLTVSIRAGFSHDTNIFGAATDAIASVIWEIAPRISYNASLTDQTFMAAAYGLTLNHFYSRPGDKSLDSHDLMLRVAHQFSKTSTLDITNTFVASRNPESLLSGVPLNSDQSFHRNQLDARFDAAVAPKIGATVKVRSVYYEYRNATLGRSLDRLENIYGLAGDYAILPTTKLVGEYRHLDVFYRKLGETKNKRSDYLMGGVDHIVAQKLSVTARAGVEWRQRASERSTTAPYAEFSSKYDYAQGSNLTGGYAYTFDEVSDTARFTDTQVHRFFANLQHRLTPLITASGSVGFEPSRLQGRRGQANVDEDTYRLGAALSYLPTKNWIISISYDYDRVDSDEAPRDLRRERVGLNGNYTF